MANLTKTDAARSIGVSRSTLYSYIKTGRISACSDGTIDTSELLRAGFTLQTPDSQESVQIERTRTPTTPDTSHLSTLVETLQRELAESKEREQAAQVEKSRLLGLLESQQRLLEAGESTNRIRALFRRWFYSQ